MTERRRLKNELAKLKARRTQLSTLVDCSWINGDNYYTVDDLIIVDSKISLRETRIAQIDAESELKNK